jgi:arginyl-tRNA synthetase|tara:strand:- start:1157 stop:1525 length:369 start_codon:yes stop_codon:yes gene_type:complete
MLDKLKNVFKKKEPVTGEPNSRTLLEQEKEAATKAKKPWVAVLDTQVNPKDIKNGFFELDWNNEFIEQLLDAGYTGETNEAIVDSWFKDVARTILTEQGHDPQRDAGHIKIVSREDGKSEAS